MKKFVIDYSMNHFNPYCGISNDTKKAATYLTEAFKNKFNFKYFVLSPKIKSRNLTCFFSTLNQKLTKKTSSILTISNSNYLFNKIKAVIGLRTKLDTKKIDLFYFATPNNFKVSHNTIKLIRIHDLIPLTHPSLTPLTSTILFKKNLYFNTTENNSYFICNSNTTKKALLKIFPNLKNRSFVVPCGINMPLFIKKPQTLNLPKKFALTVAALEPKKNLYNFLLGWKKAIILSSSIIPLVLISNKGWKNKEAKNLLDELKISYPNKIFHLQRVKEELVHYLYKKCTYFIMPSIIEGFGIPVLQGLMHSKPMILSDIEIFHEVANKAALFFDPHSPQDIANKIILINNNSKLQQELVLQAELRSKSFSDQKIQRRWVEVINNILQK